MTPTYPLQPVLDKRERERDASLIAVAQATARVRAAEEDLELLERRRSQLVSRRLEVVANGEDALTRGVSAQTALQWRGRVEECSRDLSWNASALASQSRVVAERERELSVAREQLTRREQRFQAMIRHRERWLALARQEVERREEAEHDEIAQSRRSADRVGAPSSAGLLREIAMSNRVAGTGSGSESVTPDRDRDHKTGGNKFEDYLKEPKSPGGSASPNRTEHRNDRDETAGGHQHPGVAFEAAQTRPADLDVPGPAGTGRAGIVHEIVTSATRLSSAVPEVRLTLDLGLLGGAQLRVALENGSVTVVLDSMTREGKDLVDSHHEDIRAALGKRGMRLGRLTVQAQGDRPYDHPRDGSR